MILRIAIEKITPYHSPLLSSAENDQSMSRSTGHHNTA
jgi:hypothetical protein